MQSCLTVRLSIVVFSDKDENRRFRLTALSLICSCGTWKNLHHYSKRMGDADPAGVVNLSLAGISVRILKLEPRSVVYSAP